MILRDSETPPSFTPISQSLSSPSSSTTENSFGSIPTDPIDSDAVSPIPPVRKSSRPTKFPSHFDNFICNLSDAINPHTHWCGLVHFSHIPSSIHALASVAEALREPLSYSEAIRDIRWIDAMNTELAPLQRNNTWVMLVRELRIMGYEQSKNDYFLFIKRMDMDVVIAAVYVDDIVVTGSAELEICRLKEQLDSVFSIKDLGSLSYFLGMEIGYMDAGISMSQKKFTRELLKDAGIQDDRAVVTPLPLNLKPDLSFTVQHLSQFLQEPRMPHFRALQHNGTNGQGILLRGADIFTLQAYCDSDWGACLESRRSISGYILLLGKSPITWKSKKQGVVSKGSSEVEYRAMSSASSEVAWSVRLLEELGVQNLKPVTLHCDNQSAIHIAKNPVHHERTKHIEIDVHFTRDKVLEGLLEILYLPTDA
uniref:Reverse transcriptase Ty1/copia-type domain-containing protein n=1 Tax=Chenopodium quinoa TaxID=63459 RepID=A0A803MYU8_CHEQI